MLETLLARLAELLDAWRFELEARSATDWLLFFGPVLLFEAPRYYLPMLGVVLARALGRPRIDERARSAFLARAPLVSVVVAGRNESASIERAITSLLDQDWPNFEVIVVDDHSDDDMYEIARRYARRGLIRLVRNRSERGRTGRPTASNLGTRVASGEFVVSLDADTTFDREMLRHMIAPFADPRVGVVAGNILVDGSSGNLVTRLQALEYAVSIDLHKRWSDLCGRTLQASGAIGAFRRAAVLDVGAWDPELAEDADVSLRMIKAGWRIAFAPEGVAVTLPPTSWRGLARQRYRWDRGAFRTYFSKHGRLLRPSAAGWGVALEMQAELLFSTVFTLVYPAYLVWLASAGFAILTFVLGVSTLLYATLSVLALWAVARVSPRIERPGSLLLAAVLTPFYKSFLRAVRIRALVAELLRRDYEDSYLPSSAWFHAPRF